MKVCTQKWCTKTHDTKYKTCPTCLKMSRHAKNKRKRLAYEKKVDVGYKGCKECLNVKPLVDFVSVIHRRTKPTANCTHCRALKRKTLFNPTTKSGKCREFWKKWKKNNKCRDCGCEDFRVIEADHVRGKKVNNLSNYVYWAANGGVEKMIEELKKCESRCCFCHMIKTKERSDQKRIRERRFSRKWWLLHRRREINLVKMKVGECKTCKRKVTSNTFCGFDFDHRNEETKVINISNIVRTNKTTFEKHLREEIPKCNLLCRNCHKIKTFYNEV